MPPQDQQQSAAPQGAGPEKKGMNVPLLIIAILLIAGGAAAYFYMGQGAMSSDEMMEGVADENLPPPPGAPPAPPSGDGTEGAMMMEHSHTVSFTGSGFEPKELTIKKGDTVTFVNNGTSPVWPASAMHPTHTVYDDTNLQEHCADGAMASFDSCAGIAPGESYSFTFDKAGSWGYHDHLAARNTGKIVVEE